MSYTVEEERYGNVVVEVKVDEDPMSPREWDNLTIIRGWHRDYTIGDGPDIDSDDYESFEEMVESLNEEHGPLVLLAPLYWYEHSGATCKMGPNVIDGSDHADSLARFRSMVMDDAGWDSGVAGVVMVRKEDADKEWALSPEWDMEACARAEVETYASYVAGACYGFIVSIESACDHGDTHADVLESCWGFIGEHDYALEEARSVVGGPVIDALIGGAW